MVPTTRETGESANEKEMYDVLKIRLQCIHKVDMKDHTYEDGRGSNLQPMYTTRTQREPLLALIK